MKVIEVDKISKQYRLGQVSTGTLSHDLNRWWHTLLGREDPYLRVGEVNDRTRKGRSEYVWALRNISFDVHQGDVLGIVGRNGAGKSTLLKILSRTTAPTAGRIKVRGRVASLLEVGTGFHPELSGRENIFLNGAILGMTKEEIRRKFDEIVDFAGVERYIDTPVKRYSSGMYVRLAFAVAAHLEPEILVVDEVLAVGDAEFQKKALGKMKDVSGQQGRTVLFVSHNMAAIRSLCHQALILKNGRFEFLGPVEEGISAYLTAERRNSHHNLRERTDREGNGAFRFTNILIRNEKGEATNTLFCNQKVSVELEFKAEEIDVSKIILSIGFKDQNNELLAFFSSDEMGFHLQGDSNQFKLEIPQLALRAGRYTIWLFSSYGTTSPADFCDVVEYAATIEILPVDFWVPGKMIRPRNTAFFNGCYVQ